MSPNVIREAAFITWSVIIKVLFFLDNSVRTFKDFSRRAAEDQNNRDKAAAEVRLHQGSSLFKMAQDAKVAEFRRANP